MLKDSYNRTIDYLRLSVTDQCNLRCLYCLPAKHVSNHSDTLLTDDEIINAVTSFSTLGITKLRLTGGEPLLRSGLCDLIAQLSALSTLNDISLTTNGVFLKKYAHALKKSGLNRVNISLDTLNPQTFKQITYSDNLNTVLAGIEAALSAGFSPVKINVVVFKGLNNHEVNAFVNLTKQLPVDVRFIEAMPIGHTDFFTADKWVSCQDLRETISSLTPLPLDDYPVGNGPARYYRLANAKGTVGFISALSNNFCSSCNRIRLSAQGVLFPCLDSTKGINIRQVLQQPNCSRTLQFLLEECIQVKPKQHTMLQKIANNSYASTKICYIGG